MSILVVLEPQGDGLKRSSYEALTAARGLANGAAIHGIAFNASEQQLAPAGAYGLSSCMVVAGADVASKPSHVAAAIAEAASSCGATTVIFTANAFGKEIAPRVAVRMQAGLLVRPR
jgi:electron transfer flavoprotein alpha subunit